MNNFKLFKSMDFIKNNINKFLIVLYPVLSLPIMYAQNNEESVAELSSKYSREFAIAETVDTIIRSVRAKYTEKVVGKLKKEGTGASVDFAHKKGFAPLPVQYIRAIAYDITIRQRKEKKQLFQLYLRSQWNLNIEQGLRDDFEKDGWENLVEQQEKALQAGKHLKQINWKPYVKIQTIDGKKNLRYLSADTSTAISCVTCHNKWEQKDSIKGIRNKQGTKAGKIFKMYELMGALSVVVPIQE